MRAVLIGVRRSDGITGSFTVSPNLISPLSRSTTVTSDGLEEEKWKRNKREQKERQKERERYNAIAHTTQESETSHNVHIHM